jgi:hypothetical protein
LIGFGALIPRDDLILQWIGQEYDVDWTSPSIIPALEDRFWRDGHEIHLHWVSLTSCTSSSTHHTQTTEFFTASAAGPDGSFAHYIDQCLGSFYEPIDRIFHYMLFAHDMESKHEIHNGESVIPGELAFWPGEASETRWGCIALLPGRTALPPVHPWIRTTTGPTDQLAMVLHELGHNLRLFHPEDHSHGTTPRDYLHLPTSTPTIMNKVDFIPFWLDYAAPEWDLIINGQVVSTSLSFQPSLATIRSACHDP